MGRFDTISPIDYRYMPADSKLVAKVKEYHSLRILDKIRRAVPEIVIPRLNELELELLVLSKENKDKQIPIRIDGKQNGEISLSNVFISYATRLRYRTKDIEKVSLDFKCEEAQKNDRLSDLTYSSISAFSIEANISNDIRHLFRSEIEEFTYKSFGKDRIGSSTMPHKINPVEYEQIVSLWKHYLPMNSSAVLSQITEHQGDSTNEEFPYHVLELLFALGYTTKRLENLLKGLEIKV